MSEVNLKTANEIVEGNPAMVTGSLKMGTYTFGKHIAPALDVLVRRKIQIRVGCAKTGCDAETQKFCVSTGYTNVLVFVPAGEKEENVYIASPLFTVVVVPGSFPDRDRAMREGLKNPPITALSQYGSAGNAAMASLITVAAANGKFGDASVKELDGWAVAKYVRKYLDEYDEALQNLVCAAEDDKNGATQ